MTLSGGGSDVGRTLFDVNACLVNALHGNESLG
jgi:hypothetical protein